MSLPKRKPEQMHLTGRAKVRCEGDKLIVVVEESPIYPRTTSGHLYPASLRPTFWRDARADDAINATLVIKASP